MNCLCGCFEGFGARGSSKPLREIVSQKDVSSLDAWIRTQKVGNSAEGNSFKSLAEVATKAGDIAVQSAEGRTLLHYAVLLDNKAVAGALVQMGADTGALDNSGWSPVSLAQSLNNIELQKILTSVEPTTKPVDLTFISSVPLFRRLPQSEFPRLAMAFQDRKYKNGENVVVQGEAGEEFFVIKEGQASVKIKVDSGENKVVAQLRKKDYFGEAALLRDEPRNATVCADGELVVQVISRKFFEQLGLHEKLHFARRKAVQEGELDGRMTAPQGAQTVKTGPESKFIQQALQRNENLASILGKLSAEDLQSLVASAWKRDVPAGETLIAEGDASADHMFVVASGGFQATKQSEGVVKVMGAGDSFGELALLYRAPRAATVRANRASVVWVIPRDQFKNAFRALHQERTEKYCRFLDGVELLENLLYSEKAALADAFVDVTHKRGDTVIREGEEGRSFYILNSGELEIMKDGKSLQKLTNPGQFFGERALMKSEPRAATVRVSSDEASVLALDRESFELLLGPLVDFKGCSNKTGRRASRLHQGPPGGQVVTRAQVPYENLRTVGLLGCGAFGKVTLVKDHTNANSTFALKALSKGYILKNKQQNSVLNEKSILCMCDSPFVIQLFSTYNKDQFLYFLLEPAMGGEIFVVYQEHEFHGKVMHAKFYSACVVNALDHLHSKHVIYRDLKPENLLLDSRGYCKVTDMGLAKYVIGRTYTTCGTPEYFAPEVVSNQGHTTAVDWWAVGVLVYEFMAGVSPFDGDGDPMKTFKRIMRGIDAVEFPAQAKNTWGPLVKAFCQVKPADRLPCKPGGRTNIEQHPWYKDFGWRQLEKLELPAPYVPKVNSPTDLQNFASACEEDAPPEIFYKDPGTGWDVEFTSLTK